MEKIYQCPNCGKPHRHVETDYHFCPYCSHRWTNINVPPLWHIAYRNEFIVTVRAESKSEALDKARASSNWELATGELWDEYAVVELAD